MGDQLGSEQLKHILKHLSFIQKSCTAVKKRSTADVNANEVTPSSEEEKELDTIQETEEEHNSCDASSAKKLLQRQATALQKKSNNAFQFIIIWF
jgi:hypothetical protein